MWPRLKALPSQPQDSGRPPTSYSCIAQISVTELRGKTTAYEVAVRSLDAPNDSCVTNELLNFQTGDGSAFRGMQRSDCTV